MAMNRDREIAALREDRAALAERAKRSNQENERLRDDLARFAPVRRALDHPHFQKLYVNRTVPGRTQWVVTFDNDPISRTGPTPEAACKAHPLVREDGDD